MHTKAYEHIEALEAAKDNADKATETVRLKDLEEDFKQRIAGSLTDIDNGLVAVTSPGDLHKLYVNSRSTSSS